jgi:hypothetical protein
MNTKSLPRTIANSREARQETFCRGCGEPKEHGLIVCWDCFKYSCPRHQHPLKYANGLTFEAWQRTFNDVKEA